jgi:hypothetical protein
MVEGLVHVGMAMPLSAVEITYQAIQQATIDSDLTSSWMEEDDQFPEPIWAHNSSTSLDFLDIVFPSDEAIIEAMTRARMTMGGYASSIIFPPETQFESKVENFDQL